MAQKGFLELAFLPVTYCIRLVEACLFSLVRLYDAFIYSPLQTSLWPIVDAIPRSVELDGLKVDVFTANIVSWARTLLVVPIAYSLKYDYYYGGFFCVILHDFLDHLDGIVAKVQRQKYGQLDDPLVGGFMDAFCDKIVNVLSLWTILLVTDFSAMSTIQICIYIGACAVVIAYEFTLGVVRVQDYFRAHYFREFKKTDGNSSKTSTAAVMEGKLKEKLESIGIASLCLAQSSSVPLDNISGPLGVTCLLLSIRLAHSSLTSKLAARAPQIRSRAHASEDEDEMKVGNKAGNDPKVEESADMTSEGKCAAETNNYNNNINDKLRDRSDHCNNDCLEKPNNDQMETQQMVSTGDGQQQVHGLTRCLSMPGTKMLQNTVGMDARAERVYTVGCFDLFHHGHVTLLNRMRNYGKKIIVGVHDSRSIYQLKKRVPIDSTLTRMRNVKQFADEVFCVVGTDPTPYIECIFDVENSKDSAIYIRGNDMPEFPARHLCEQLMTIKLLPYTEGVSSTKLRKDLINSGSIELSDGALFY